MKKCVFGLLLCFTLAATPVFAAAVRISAAASLTDAVKELVAGYRQQHPEIELLPNFASSGALAKQIVAGAPADIYISANPKWMDYLQQEGLIATTSRKVLVKNSLAFVGLPDRRINSLAQLPELRRIALCSPKSSPAGKYAEQALTAAGVYRQLLAEQKLIFAKDVRQALLYADRGEVDGAFVYQTDALLAKQAKILFAVPQQLYPQVSYPIALLNSAAAKPASQAFYAYLVTPEAQQLLRRYGFILP